VEAEEEVAQQDADLGDAAVGVGEDGEDAGDDRERRQQQPQAEREANGDEDQR
jgi:hypothetical protein